MLQESNLEQIRWEKNEWRVTDMSVGTRWSGPHKQYLKFRHWSQCWGKRASIQLRCRRQISTQGHLRGLERSSFKTTAMPPTDSFFQTDIFLSLCKCPRLVITNSFCQVLLIHNVDWFNPMTLPNNQLKSEHLGGQERWEEEGCWLEGDLWEGRPGRRSWAARKHHAYWPLGRLRRVA